MTHLGSALRAGLAVAIVLLAQGCGNRNTPKMIQPPFLKPGDVIALTCQASHIREGSTVVARADSILTSWGYRTVCSDLVYKDWHGCAGSPEERKDELMKYLLDPEVKCILAITGGFGSMYPSMLVPRKVIRNNPKWMVGYSDITSVLSVWGAAGVMCVHGADAGHMVGGGKQDESSLYVRNILEGRFPEYTVANRDSVVHNIPGKASGRLWGGNIETLQPTMSSEFDCLSRDEDIILFIEDTGENLIHIERRLTYLELHDMMPHIKGVICGYFRNYKADSWYSMEQMIDSHLSKHGIPVIYNFPAGHRDPNYALVCGARCEIDVSDTLATVKFFPER